MLSTELIGEAINYIIPSSGIIVFLTGTGILIYVLYQHSQQRTKVKR